MAKRKTINPDEQYLGPEPTWEDQDTLTEEKFRSKYANALNWYNYFSDKANAKKNVLEYLTKFQPDRKEWIDATKKVPEWAISNTLVSICRMRLNGLTRKSVKWADTEDFVEKAFEKIVNTAMHTVEEKKEAKVEKPVVSLQMRVLEAAQKASEGIEDAIEALSKENKYKLDFDTYAYLRKNQVKGMIAKRMIDFYKPEAEELEEALAGKCEQLVEGYSHFEKAHLKNFAKSMRSIVDDLERWVDNQKATRKPRKKKVKTADKQVEKLQYLKAFEELKLVSIPPEKVVGAMVVWVYNVKYKKLGKYVASTREGFEFKGTSIQKWDETNSVQKTLRKPEEVLQRCLTGGKIVLRKLLDELTTKEQSMNGRFNSDTIILRIADL